MKYNHIYKRLLAGLLCITLTVGFVPAGVSAQEDATQETTEVISLREENVKHFDMGDGTYQAIAYSHPIHEKDEDGNWQDIDFSMDLTRQNGTRVYANEAGSTAFAASYRANQPIMTLGEEGSSISMTLVTDTPSTWSLFGSSVAAEVTGAEVDIQTLEDAQNANFSNTLLYEEVMPGIDLEYIVDPWCVKENIIVNQPTESYFYRFLLEMDGMYPVMQEDGSILIYSEETNEPEYEIPAPYMYDAEGEESFDVFYNIETTNGDYYLTVFADSNWINAEDRVFPVVIDPSYVNDGILSRDTYINEDAAGETRGTYNFFYVGENEVAYIHVPIPDLPVAATLEDAALRVYYYYKAKVNYGSVQITAHKVTGFNWEENALTWNSVVARDPVNFGLSTTVLGADNDNGGIVTAYGNIGAYADTPVLTAFDITNAVQDWINGNPNYGIGLRYVTTSPNRSVQFRSTEGPAVHRPMAQYQYRVPESDYYFMHYYDGTMSGRTNLFSEAINFVNAVYWEEFGIYFSPVVNMQYAEYTTGEHKDVINISNQLLDEITGDNEIIVYWTDYPVTTYCTHESGECISINQGLNVIQACVWDHRPVIHVLNILPDTASDAQFEACMAMLLAHETAHTLGMDDNYEATAHKADGYQCIMEEMDYMSSVNGKSILVAFYEDILNNECDAFCNSCKRLLRAAIE